MAAGLRPLHQAGINARADVAHEGARLSSIGAGLGLPADMRVILTVGFCDAEHCIQSAAPETPHISLNPSLTGSGQGTVSNEEVHGNHLAPFALTRSHRSRCHPCAQRRISPHCRKDPSLRAGTIH